jgi:16S rRNA (cytidine1402-2'-O)-methyltransferase
LKGILYVVATPIGNLKDITLRAIDVLRESDFVIAENRERALKLLSHLEIRKPIITINTYSEGRRSRTIIEQLTKGKDAALISAAGTPCISDPGRITVQQAYEAGIEVVSVPGVSAPVAAMAVAGLQTDRFLFYGFLPQKKGKKKRVLELILQQPFPVVIFESPRRIEETLDLISMIGGRRLIVVARELTKIYEEVWRGWTDEAADGIRSGEVKGEFTVIVDAGSGGAD